MEEPNERTLPRFARLREEALELGFDGAGRDAVQIGDILERQLSNQPKGKALLGRAQAKQRRKATRLVTRLPHGINQMQGGTRYATSEILP